MTDERRERNRKQRNTRLTIAGVSTPLSIIIVTIIHQRWGDQMGTDFNIAVASLISSGVTVLTLCFHDLRAVLLSRFQRRRHDDEPRGKHDGS